MPDSSALGARLGTERADRVALTRAVALAVAGVVEYQVLAVLFDASRLGNARGLLAGLSGVGDIVAILVVVLTAGLLLQGDRVLGALRRASPAVGSLELRWVAVHLLSYAALTGTSTALFSGRTFSPGAFAALFSAWAAFAFLTLVTLLRAGLGGAFRPLLVVLVRVVAAGAILGGAAWVIAVRSRPLWGPLATWTLRVSAALLAPFSDAVSVDLGRSELTLEAFSVYIEPRCSGIEGIGLMGVFVGGYLFHFRKTLRFPLALALLPAAVVIVWLTNALRIAILVMVGARLSPAIAFGGFHSKAGWILFCGVALGAVAVSRRIAAFARHPAGRTADAGDWGENPTAAFCLPFLALLATSQLTGAFTAHLDALYGIRLVAALAVLFAYRGYYRADAIRWCRPALGPVLVGAIVFAAWLVLTPEAPAAAAADLVSELDAMSKASRGVWIATRVVGTVAVVPVVEELCFRGYLQRRIQTEDFAVAPFTRPSWLAVLVSALAFGALHQAWLAGLAAGVAYSGAAAARGRLWDAVVAHATTNALITAWVLAFGRWDLWM